MADESNNKLTPEQMVQQDIDADKGLASKRKLLTVTSLILMALAFSGAKVEEANTFLAKLSFDNHEGIPLLLAISIVFLLLRYYNYAQPYHYRLYRIWAVRMLHLPPFFWFDSHAEEHCGLLVELEPPSPGDERGDFENHFVIDGLFRRALGYVWHWDSESVLFREAIPLKVWLLPEIKHHLGGYFKHRENLDILSPYLIGLAALLCYGVRWLYMG